MQTIQPRIHRLHRRRVTVLSAALGFLFCPAVTRAKASGTLLTTKQVAELKRKPVITAFTPTFGEPILKIKCQSRGDSMVRSDSGEPLLEQRLISFSPTTMRTRQGEIHGICTIRTDPPGYKWVTCGKEANGAYYTGNWDSPIPINPVEAIANIVQHRSWRGACKIRR